MNITCIGCLPLDLEIGSFGTLSKYMKCGYQVHIIIVAGDNKDWTKLTLDKLKESCEKTRISDVHFADGFDYAAVTQENVSILGSIIKKIKPSIVIMPFWKAFNEKRKILARSSLVACRGIGNILMYEIDKNTHFLPSVYITISDEIPLKISCLQQYSSGDNYRSMLRKINAQNRFYTKKVGINIPTEVFESHRMLLVDHGGL